MTPEEVGSRFAAALGDSASASVSGGAAFARATVDVPAERWRDAVLAARDLGCDFFDWLSAVDELAEGFSLVVHVWSIQQRYGVLLRTRVSGDNPGVPSIVDIYPGAAWHERETHEMFGLDFPGHLGLKPLLLPPEFEGHPLRKDFVLASRVAKPWPGAKEPGESHDSSAARRQPMRPPGVPDPREWGPGAAAPSRPGAQAPQGSADAAPDRDAVAPESPADAVPDREAGEG